MFILNLLNKLPNKLKLGPKKTAKPFEPLFNTNYTPPPPGEIRESIKKMSRCPKCQFLIFDNYWTNEVETYNLKPCPTCGYK